MPNQRFRENLLSLIVDSDRETSEEQNNCEAFKVARLIIKFTAFYRTNGSPFLLLDSISGSYLVPVEFTSLHFVL